MNAVSFRFDTGPYFNLSAGGSETWLDWAVGIFGEVFIDQKFMGLFSLLFGAGMILFIDRAAARGRRAVALNLWRNALLLLIGFLHFLLCGRRRVDGLCHIVGLPDRHAKAAEPGAHLRRRRRLHAVCCLRSARAVHRRHDRRTAVGSLTPGDISDRTSGAISDQETIGASRPAGASSCGRWG